MASNQQVPLLLVVMCLLDGFYLVATQPTHVVLESVECTCVAPICVNSTCQLVKVDNLRNNITIAFMVTKKVKFIKFRVRRRTQNQLKQWNNAEMDFTIDYCDFAKGTSNPVINILAPGIRDVIGDSLRPCPFQGWFLFKYTTDPNKKETNRPLGQLLKSEVMLVTINSKMFFKLVMLSKVQ